MENISSSGVGVRCQAGWDGGLAQTFTLSVTHARGHTSRGHHARKAAPRVLANTSTAPRPEFALSGLEPGTEYLLTIMGVNGKGQSEPVRIAVVTLKDVAEKRTSPGKCGRVGAPAVCHVHHRGGLEEVRQSLVDYRERLVASPALSNPTQNSGGQRRGHTIYFLENIMSVCLPDTRCIQQLQFF